MSQAHELGPWWMKVNKSTNTRIISKIKSIYGWTESLDPERCKQLNMSNYSIDTLASIKVQLVDKNFTASINQAGFVNELYKSVRPSLGVRLKMNTDNIYDNEEFHGTE